jgi:hypothetical protein
MPVILDEAGTADWIKFHTTGTRGRVQAVPRARNENVSVQEFARGASWSVGRRTDGRGDGKMSLAETTAGPATIDYLERTVANHLRHAMFVGLAE